MTAALCFIISAVCLFISYMAHRQQRRIDQLAADDIADHYRTWLRERHEGKGLDECIRAWRRGEKLGVEIQQQKRDREDKP